MRSAFRVHDCLPHGRRIAAEGTLPKAQPNTTDDAHNGECSSRSSSSRSTDFLRCREGNCSGGEQHGHNR